MKIPEVLTVLDLEDVMTALGAPADRTNIARALQQHPIEGVVAPEKRGQSWRIPREALLHAVAACLRRRGARAAAASRWAQEPIGSYLLPAARLLMAADLTALVPKNLRRTVREEHNRRLAAAAARARQRQEEVERKRRAEQRMHEQEEKRRNASAQMQIYCAARMAAHQAHFAGKTDIYESAAWEPFLAAWPYPKYPLGGPDWWLPPPGSVEAMRPRLDPWLDGKIRDMPSADDLVPDIDLTKPWPWRACV